MDKLFDVLERINARQTPQEILELVKAPLPDIEADYVSFCLLYRPGNTLDDIQLHHNLPKEFTDFVDPNIKHDAALQNVKGTVKPFRWDSIAPNDNQTMWPRIIGRARDFGFDNGVMIPLPGSNGTVGHVWYGGPKFRDWERQIVALRIVSANAFYRIQYLNEGYQPTDLNTREIDVLSWLAEGKTAWEIGTILNISRRTVEWHIRNVMKKLNAVNSLQAVVKASQMGFLKVALTMLNIGDFDL